MDTSQIHFKPACFLFVSFEFFIEETSVALTGYYTCALGISFFFVPP